MDNEITESLNGLFNKAKQTPTIEVTMNTTQTEAYDDVGLREERLKLETKLKKSGGDKIFVEEVIAAFERNEVHDLEFRLRQISKHKQAVISTQNSDEELKLAKLKVSGLTAPYNEQKRACDAKSRFIGLLLQELNGFQPEEK